MAGVGDDVSESNCMTGQGSVRINSLIALLTSHLLLITGFRQVQLKMQI